MKISGIIIGMALILVSSTVFAQDVFQLTQSQNITCGNNSCEDLVVNFKVGDEKRIQLGEKSYTFKLIRIEKIPQESIYTDPDGTEHAQTYYNYTPYFSIDGGSPLKWEEINQEVGLGRNAIQIQAEYREMGQDVDTATVRAKEPDFCMVPDCGKSVELNIFKRWNLVPLYFFALEVSKQKENQLTAFKNSTCKLINFPVMYGYDSVKKEYVRLYLFGMSIDQFYNSLNEFQQRGIVNGQQRILNGTFFNAVWVYSDTGCKLVTEVPSAISDNFLYMLAAMQNQASSYSSAPVAIAKETPVRQERVVQPVEQPTATETIVQEQPVSQQEAVEQAEQEAVVQTAVKPTLLRARAPVKLLLQSQESGFSFAAGWNFFMGTNDMAAKTLDGIRGNCTIQRAYTFDAENQSWTKITTAPSLGQAFIFKVTQPCMFGFPDIAPPTLPVGDIPLAVRK